MKKPNGIDLLHTLIRLLAEQESVHISYEIEQNDTKNELEEVHNAQ